MHFPRSSPSFSISLSLSSSLRVRLLSSSSSSPAVRRLARPCIIYIIVARGCACTLQLHTQTPFAPELRNAERVRRVTSTIRPRSRPRPCRAAKIGAARSLARSPARSFVRSLARARGFFATIQTFPRDRNALTLSRSTGFADNWMGWITIHERVTCIRRGSASRKRRLGRASMVCTMS